MSGSGDREVVFNAELQLWLFWDRSRGCYYYYDVRSDMLVYSDHNRTRVARPPDLPRSRLLNPYGEQSSLPFNYSGSPPRSNAGYTTRNSIGSPPASPPTQAQDNRSAQWPRTTPPTGPPTSAQGGRPSQWSPAGGPGSLTAAIGAMSVNSGTVGQGASSAQQMSGLLPVPVQPRVVEMDGMRTVLTHDARSKVSTAYATGPAKAISDPVLYRKGVPSKRMLINTGPSEKETLFSGYSIRKPGPKFFCVGRVFMVLWVEPAGEGGTVITSVEGTMAQSDDPSILPGRYNERIFSKVRRFVVVRAGGNFCSALPVVTYGKQGVGKPGVVKSDHAIIHTEREPPLPLPSERPARGEQGMRSIPIRVVPDSVQDILDPLSRIDFAKVHTIQHNIKVKAVGVVHPHSMSALIGQFNNVWNTQVITRDNLDDSRAGDDAGSSSSRVPRSSQDREHLRRDSVASGTVRSSTADSSRRTTRDAYRRMRDRGFSQEQAFSALVDHLRAAAPRMSEAQADARVRFLLSQQTVAAEADDDENDENDENDDDNEEEHDNRDRGMTREEHDELYDR